MRFALAAAGLADIKRGTTVNPGVIKGGTVSNVISDNCVVEGEFAVGRDDMVLKTLLEENDVEWDDGNLTVRRVVNPTGRSRSFVNDSPVQVQLLAAMSSRLVDIHSQHQTLLLSDRRFQLSVLDQYARDKDLLDTYRDDFRTFNSLSRELEELDASIARLRSEYDYDKARLRKLEEARLKENELESLELEQKQLANAEEIKEGLCTAETLLGTVRTGGEEVSVPALLRDVSRHLEKVSGYVPAVSSLAERLDSCRIELDDILSELSDINSATEVSAGRLEEVEDRLSLIYSLLRTFSCRDENELIALRDSLAESVSGAESCEERRSALQARVEAASEKLARSASALTDIRKSVSGKLSEAITATVRSMELPDAEFRIDVNPAGMTADGADTVSYSFSSTGKNPADISRCASGGEMSRIMLALKSVMSGFADMPVMIFDEIDTGVSGSVADRMGTVICGMGSRMQVFAITHLPQVAAKGSAHYLVTKTVSGGRTVSEIKRISGRERVLEIARMLSGSRLTDAAVANAESLLSSGQ